MSNRNTDILHLEYMQVSGFYIFVKKTHKLLSVSTLQSVSTISRNHFAVVLYNIKQNSILFHSYTHYGYAMYANPKDVLCFVCIELCRVLKYYWTCRFLADLISFTPILQFVTSRGSSSCHSWIIRIADLWQHYILYRHSDFCVFLCR